MLDLLVNHDSMLNGEWLDEAKEHVSAVLAGIMPCLGVVLDDSNQAGQQVDLQKPAAACGSRSC